MPCCNASHFFTSVDSFLVIGECTEVVWFHYVLSVLEREEFSAGKFLGCYWARPDKEVGTCCSWDKVGALSSGVE